MKKRAFLRVGGVLLFLMIVLVAYASTFVISYGRLFQNDDPLIATDISRLLPTKVLRIDKPHKVEQLQAALREAHDKNWKVSIAGSRHSQGGHTYYNGALVLDMKDFNEILDLDLQNKTITVEAGATWDDIQNYINPHGLAVKVMQSSNVFTVGGTMSANAHGRDLRETTFVDTVRSFHLMQPNGDIIIVSRTEHPELFKLVIGGYGMFGIILDATIQLTDDVVLEKRAAIMDYKEFPAYFADNIQTDSTATLMLVRPSIAQENFLQELIVTTWHTTTRTADAIHALGLERNVLRDKFFFGLSRSFDWAKDLRWSLQKSVDLSPGETALISRNNSMRPPETPLEFLDYYSTKDTDILQEYYVPVRNFVPFMDELRTILRNGSTNILSVTVRYVEANVETFLPYAPRENAFAVVVMSNVKLSAQGQADAEYVTRKIVDAALRFNGTYYLTYQLWPTAQQLQAAYPNANEVFEKKRFYDPKEIFMSKFYEKYGHAL